MNFEREFLDSLLGRKELPPVTPIPRLVTCADLDDTEDDGDNDIDINMSPEKVARIWAKIRDQWISDPHS